MIIFKLPDDEKLLAAVGTVALRHTQLDHVLRMMIKSFLGSNVKEALDATEGLTSSELRETIKRLAKQRLPDEATKLKLSALLGSAKRATRRRNELVHRLWAYKLDDGTPVVRGDDHQWQPLPSTEELSTLADQLNDIGVELNKARLEGFVRDALIAFPKAILPTKPAAQSQQDTVRQNLVTTKGK